MERPQHADRLRVPITERDHIRGPASAPVTVVEYGDYECPWCVKVFPMLNAMRHQSGDRLRFVFRHFPQSTIHRHAGVASEAAEAAGAQGKFWEMHDLLFERQDDLADGDFSRFAVRVGLELYRFESDLSSARFAERVQQDYDGGQLSGVNKTPTLFINGTKYSGKLELQALLEGVSVSR
jgi:protein-disulfide isomerase